MMSYRDKGTTTSTFIVSREPDFSGNLTCDGTADEVQIQEAINRVIALGGGTVKILDGDYNFAASILLPDQQNLYLAIRGAGYKTHRPTQLIVGGDFWAFNLTRTAGFSNDLLFEGFSIVADVDGTGSGIYLSAPTNLYRVNLQGMRFEKLEHALYGNANAAGSWSNAHINDCHFWGCGLASSTTPAVTIEDASLVRFENCDWTGTSDYILLYGFQGADIRIHHCRFEGDPTSGTGDLVNFDSVYNAHVESNVFQRVRTNSAGLSMGFAEGQIVTNNHFQYLVSGAANTHGIRLPNLIHDVRISGNRFIDTNFTYGIRSDNIASTGRVFHNTFESAITNLVDLGPEMKTPFIYCRITDPNANLGDHPVVVMPDGTDTYVYDQIYFPLEFQEVVTAQVVVVQNTAANPNMVWTVDTDWGKICSAEDYLQHSDSGGATSSMLQDDFVCLDISGALTGVAGGDLVGVSFMRDGNAGADTVGGPVYYLGIRVRYV